MPDLDEPGEEEAVAPSEDEHDDAVRDAAVALLLLDRQSRHVMRATLSAAVGIMIGHRLSTQQSAALVDRTQQYAIEMIRDRARSRSAEIFSRQTSLDAIEITDEAAAADASAAQAAALSLSRQWTDALEQRQALAPEQAHPYRSPAAEFRGAAEDVSASIERTATTETFAGWNEEWRRQSSDRDDVTLVHEWNAELEACPKCWALHGTTVHDDETFPSGDPPLHPRCHCRINTTVLQ